MANRSDITDSAGLSPASVVPADEAVQGQVVAAHSVAPLASLTENERHALQTPLHATAKDARTLLPYFAILPAAWGVRYLARGPIDTLKGVESFDWFRRVRGRITEPVFNYFRGNFNAGAVKPEYGIATQEQVINHLRSIGEGKEKAVDWVQKLEADLASGGTKEFSELQSKLNQRYKNLMLDVAFDTTLGAYMFGVTGTYEYNVYKNIRKVYAETVAYEDDKRPESIRLSDFRHSNNRLVQNTMLNFRDKTFSRLGTDLGFFGRWLGYVHPSLSMLKNFKFGETIGGLKLAQSLGSVYTRRNTIFEEICSLIEKKINPIRGISESITAPDLIDVYQNYAHTVEPRRAFHDITIHQTSDVIDWKRAESVFSLAAELMNRTYKYKHNRVDEMPAEMRVRADPGNFTLPKFLYLLGHDLIDPAKPEQSMAYVQVANQYGMQAVKQLQASLEKGMALEEAIKPYSIDFYFLKQVDARRAEEQAVRRRTVDTNPPPSTRIHDHSPTERVQSMPTLGL